MAVNGEIIVSRLTMWQLLRVINQAARMEADGLLPVDIGAQAMIELLVGEVDLALLEAAGIIT